MTTSEVAEVLGRLRFERDDRDPPDERRRGRFKAGWEDATVRGEVYAEETLQRLTWHNLGYRFGSLLGHRSGDEITEAYEILADLYHRPQANIIGQALRLISWNVNGRVERLQDQVTALTERKPDVVALQEVRVTTASALKAELVRIGLPHNTDSFGVAADPSVLTGRRRDGELIASRWPVTALPPGAFPVPWTERILSAVIESPWTTIETHTVHVPNGSTNGWTKIETFEGLYRRLACRSDRPRILCGDFNSPQNEMSDGRLVTWGQNILPTGETVIKGTWKDRAGREDSNERWDLGERSVLEGLAVFDLPDVYRTLHGYGAEEFSWCWKGKGGTPRRFDHVFASRELNAVRCQYLHSLREAGLSDHSPIEVDFEPRKVDCGAA